MNKLIALVISLFIFIILIIGVILLLDFADKGGFKNTKKANLPANELQAELNRLSKIPQVSQTGTYNKLRFTLTELNRKNTSAEKKYEHLKDLWENVVGTYQTTSDPELYKLQLVLIEYIKANYPDEDLQNYKPLCYDPNCAENPQPKEIASVINKIKNSTLPDYVKSTDVQNLISFGYVNDNWRSLKVDSYLIFADLVKYDPEYTRANLNTSVSNEIHSYVKKEFPKEYEEYLKRGVHDGPVIVTPAPEPTYTN